MIIWVKSGDMRGNRKFLIIRNIRCYLYSIIMTLVLIDIYIRERYRVFIKRRSVIMFPIMREKKSTSMQTDSFINKSNFDSNASVITNF